MVSFSDDAWNQTARLREAIHRLPFNRELAAGTLAPERFRRYIVQDALYLGQFSRALAIAAAKAPDAATVEVFAHSAQTAVAVEQVLHEKYLAKFGIDPATLAATEAAPDCLAYTSFLLTSAHQEPWEVLVAALLPCFRVYWEVGCQIAKEAERDNRYRAWIDTYADAQFGEAVERVMAIADKAAEGVTTVIRTRMLAAFVRATQYEWLFWDGAYLGRGWPIGDLPDITEKISLR
jgi:thiaminase/transcriptional activator TenA